MWRAEDPQGNESGKVKWAIVPYTQGQGLDLGCGPNKAFPHFIGVDNYTDTRLFGIQMQPDVTSDVTKLDVFSDESMDFVYSSHTLEHIQDHHAALIEWWRVIKPGGYLILYLPHKDFYPNVGTEGANPDHKHDFLPDDIIQTMKMLRVAHSGWNLLVNENRSEGMEYSFLQVYQKRADKVHIYQETLVQKRACVVRYGGFGDMIQASYILPALKREGYHVTVMTTPKGQDIIKHDPHVDAWILQGKDQVPNDQLGPYWDEWKRHFDRWINLCESVEGTFLAMPGRPLHYWPKAARHAVLDRNYFEMTAKIAGVPFEPVGKFYETPEEREVTTKNLSQLPGKFVILFVMSGSAVHKAWIHMDQFIAKVLVGMPSAQFITVGDADCAILEAGWAEEDRVTKLSGRINIRETMALAKQCQVVFGPETGVLNAVANEDNMKIVMLSHSSEENLTKHWKHTQALSSKTAACYPCHQLHYNWDHCAKSMQDGEHDGTALCAASISVDEVYAALARCYDAWLINQNVRAAE